VAEEQVETLTSFEAFKTGVRNLDTVKLGLENHSHKSDTRMEPAFLLLSFVIKMCEMRAIEVPYLSPVIHNYFKLAGSKSSSQASY
jgi:hypothetical protein